MKKISKKNESIFIDEMKKGLLNIGAVASVSDPLKFDFVTKYGNIYIRIDKDQDVCYSVFCRFLDVQSTPIHVGANLFSGKWNHHFSPEGSPKLKAEFIINKIKSLN